jgi:glycosyltransferase involved in cell wall biosynthesis
MLWLIRHLETPDWRINVNEIVIVTPTYNRLNKLPQLYESLKSQKNSNFDWCIIDDGSNDGTADYIKKIKQENQLNISYVYQKNGGKARALNKAFKTCEYATLFVIVDSDDYLLPKAIDVLLDYSNKYSNRNDVGSLFFYYETMDGKVLKPSGKLLDQDVIMNRFEYNKRYKSNDGCMCYFGKVVKKYNYPEFVDENYIGPTVLQMEMAKEYDIVFSAEIIGVAEYQVGGLTDSGRKLRLQNPYGMLYYSGQQQSNLSPFVNRIKHAIGAQAYRFIADANREILKQNDLEKYLKFWAIIPGIGLKLYWQLKHKQRKN